MKYTLYSLFLAAALILTGCAGISRTAENLDRKLDSVEENIESRVEDTLLIPDEKTPGSPTTPAAPVAEPTAGEITAGEARDIALNHAGFTQEQVKYLRTEYEIDDGLPQYEVTFHHDRWEYDYEIDARTGNILSFERDD